MGRFVIRSFFEDIRNFRNMIPYRREKIEKAVADPLPETYAVNELSLMLHPDKQKVIVSSVSDFDSKTKIITFSPCGKETLAPFRAGQGINIRLDREKTFFPLISVPDEKYYSIMVCDDSSDKVSKFLYNVSENTEIEISGPTGLFYYSHLRDGDSVVLIHDVSGTAPVLSICRYLSCDKNVTVKVIALHREDDDKKFGMFDNMSENISVYRIDSINEIHKNFLADIDTPSAFFVSGEQDFCSQVKEYFDGFKYLRGKIRLYISDPSSKRDVQSEKFSCQLLYRDEFYSFDCFSDETLLSAFERNSIPTQAKCRVGECGYCRCKLLEGKVETILCSEIDSMRGADEKYGFIHPCRAFPKSDIKVKL